MHLSEAVGSPIRDQLVRPHNCQCQGQQLSGEAIGGVIPDGKHGVPSQKFGLVWERACIP